MRCCAVCWRCSAPETGEQADGSEAKSTTGQLVSFHGVIERTIRCFLSVAAVAAKGRMGKKVQHCRRDHRDVRVCGLRGLRAASDGIPVAVLRSTQKPLSRLLAYSVW